MLFYKVTAMNIALFFQSYVEKAILMKYWQTLSEDKKQMAHILRHILYVDLSSEEMLHFFTSSDKVCQYFIKCRNFVTVFYVLFFKLWRFVLYRILFIFQEFLKENKTIYPAVSAQLATYNDTFWPYKWSRSQNLHDGRPRLNYYLQCGIPMNCQQEMFLKPF